jgi:hypothetical protein
LRRFAQQNATWATIVGVGWNRLMNRSTKRVVAKKPLGSKTLGRFGAFAPASACVPESGFVNHVRIVSNRFVPPRFFQELAAQAALTHSPEAAR